MNTNSHLSLIDEGAATALGATSARQRIIADANATDEGAKATSLPFARTEVRVGGPVQAGRDRSGDVFRGVANELAHRLNVDPLLVRALFVVSNTLPGLGVVIYFALAARFDREGAIKPAPHARPTVAERTVIAWRRREAGEMVRAA